MKVRRYPAARTNVDMLQSQRRGAISPEEGAAAAAAPYEAIADIAGSVSDAAVREGARQQQLVREEDDILKKTAIEQFKLFVSEIENDPNNQNQLQPDGTPTASTMLESYEQRAQDVRDMLGQMQGPRDRENALKLFDMTVDATRMEMRTAVNNRREAWNAQGLFDLREIQFEAQDLTAYNQTNQELRDKNIITQEQYNTANNAGKNAQLEAQAQVLADSWYEEYKDGKGDAAYEQIVKSDLPPELKSLTESKIETQQENLKKVDQKKAAIAKVEVLKNQTKMKIALKMGLPLPMSIEEFVNSGMGYTPQMDAQMITWGQELILSQIKGFEVDEAYSEFKGFREKGIPLENSKKNSELLDIEIRNGVTPDMTPDEITTHGEVTMRDAGFMSFSYDQMFNTSPRTASGLGRAAQIWGRMMLDTDINTAVQTRTGDEQQSMLTDTWNNIQAGIDPTEAGQMAIEMNKMWDRDKTEMQARQDYYGGRDTQGNSRGQKNARDGFKNLINDSFDTVPWLTSPIDIWVVGDPGQAEFITEGGFRDAYAFYEEYFYQGSMRSGNMEHATAYANQMFSQNFNMNNLNGDMQIERGGVKGDWNWKRESWIEENKDETFIYGMDGAKIGSLNDAGDISYRNPVILNGDYVYEVWGEAGPLMQDVEVKGKLERHKVVDRISTKDATDKEVETVQEETKEQLRDIQNEYETALRMQKSGNIYSREGNVETLREYEAKVRETQRRSEEKIADIRKRNAR